MAAVDEALAESTARGAWDDIVLRLAVANDLGWNGPRMTLTDGTSPLLVTECADSHFWKCGWDNITDLANEQLTAADLVMSVRRVMDLLRAASDAETDERPCLPVVTLTSVHEDDSGRFLTFFPSLFAVSQQFKHVVPSHTDADCVMIGPKERTTCSWVYHEPISDHMYSAWWIASQCTFQIDPMNSWNAAMLFDDVAAEPHSSAHRNASDDGDSPFPFEPAALSAMTPHESPPVSASDGDDEEASAELSQDDEHASGYCSSTDEGSLMVCGSQLPAAGTESDSWTSHGSLTQCEGNLEVDAVEVQLAYGPSDAACVEHFGRQYGVDLFGFTEPDELMEAPSGRVSNDGYDAPSALSLVLQATPASVRRLSPGLALLCDVATVEADLAVALDAEFSETAADVLSAFEDPPDAADFPPAIAPLVESVDAFCFEFRRARHLAAVATVAELQQRYRDACDELRAEADRAREARYQAAQQRHSTPDAIAWYCLWQMQYPRWLVATCLLQFRNHMSLSEMNTVMRVVAENDCPWLSHFHPRVRCDVMLVWGHMPEREIVRAMINQQRMQFGRSRLAPGQISRPESLFRNPAFIPSCQLELEAFLERLKSRKQDAFLRIFGQLPPSDYF